MPKDKPATAKVVDTFLGQKLYQDRARAALPLLVRQAQARMPIVYSDLAVELGMPNPRNLDKVLGAIGNTLELLSKDWGEKLPPIQCVVLNKKTRLPSNGVGWLPINLKTFARKPLREKQEIVRYHLQPVYHYKRWIDVLRHFGLAPSDSDVAELVKAAAARPYRGPESEAHKRLKRYIARNPRIVGLPSETIGKMEVPLPSADRLDVSFHTAKFWVAAEIKAGHSDEVDITRGMFQCIKYAAVMEAKLVADRKLRDVRAVLVIEGRLSPHLVALKNRLGVQVIEGISAPVKGSGPRCSTHFDICS